MLVVGDFGAGAVLHDRHAAVCSIHVSSPGGCAVSASERAWGPESVPPHLRYGGSGLSTCSTIEALRTKAEIVSAFCIIFGLDIATLKLRTFHISWGNENRGLLDPLGKPFLCPDNMVDTRDYISIFQGAWVEQRIPLPTEGAMRYLGVHWDMNLSGQTIMTMTIDKLEAAVARIQTFPCTADIKRTVLERCIIPSLLY